MNDLSAYTFGKIPPQNRELEQAVIGACLLEKEAVTVAITILKPDYFYVNAHSLIFSAIVRLFAKNNPIDLLTVTDDLRRNGSLEDAGGAYALTEMTSRVASGANVEYHATLVKQFWMKREVIRIGSDSIRSAYDDTSDEFELIDRQMSELSAIVTQNANSTKTIQSVLVQNLKDLEEAAGKSEEEKYIIGRTTGIYSLDRKSLGYCNGNLVIIAGRPKEGKSTLAVQSMLLNALNGVPVGFFSLEMKESEIATKLISMHSGVELERIRKSIMNKQEWERYNASNELIHDTCKIYINDTSGISMNEISAFAKGWKSKFGIQMLFVDYLQLISVENSKKISNRDQEIGHITRSLKVLAKNLDIPVVALSQLSRDIEKRTKAERRPQLSDLRESGNIEQDADMVMFVYRPDKHGIEFYDDGQPTQDTAEVIIGAHRMGGNAIIRTKFMGEINRFDDKQFSKYDFSYFHESKQRQLKSFTEPEKENDNPF